MEVLRPPVLVQGKHSMWKHKFADMQTTGLFGDAGDTIAIGEMHWYGPGAALRFFLPSLHALQPTEKHNQHRERNHSVWLWRFFLTRKYHDRNRR
jgi:hypothetical protein